MEDTPREDAAGEEDDAHRSHVAEASELKALCARIGATGGAADPPSYARVAAIVRFSRFFAAVPGSN